MPETDLSGLRAIVTGASSGIGRAIALGLAGRGANVGAIGRSFERLEAVRAAASELKGQMCLHEADLSEAEGLDQVADRILADYSRIDILVHSAGIIRRAAIDQTSISDLDAQYRLNMRAPLALTRRLSRALAASQGQIVFVNSSAGIAARGGVGAYAGTKHALRAIADSLREEIGPQGVRVLSVFPGQTATPLQAALYAESGRTYSPESLLQAEDVAAIVLSALSLPRTAEVTEIRIRPARKPSV